MVLGELALERKIVLMVTFKGQTEKQYALPQLAEEVIFAV